MILNSRQRGIAALPITIGVMTVVFLVIVVTLSIGFSELFVAERGKEYRAGLYASDFGANEILLRLAQDPTYPDNTASLSVSNCPAAGYNLSSLAPTGTTIGVKLTTIDAGLSSADCTAASTACPELTIICPASYPGNGDKVRTVTSTACPKTTDTVEGLTTVESTVITRIEQNGKLSICSWKGNQ